jgi:Ion channel
LIDDSLTFSLFFQVGYGDISPVTPYGKTVAAISYIFAIIMMSYPVAILGEAFLEEYEAIKNETPTLIKRKAASLLFNGEKVQHMVDVMEEELDRAGLAWQLVRASHERVRRSFLLFTPGKYSMTHAVYEALQHAHEYQQSSRSVARDQI